MPWNDNANPGPWGTPPERDDAGKPEAEPNWRPEPPRRPPPTGGPDLRDSLGRLAALARRWFGGWNAPGLRPAILMAVGGTVVVAWMVTGLYTVQANQEAVITRLGVFARSEGPGLHYHLPLPLERAELVSVTNQNKTLIGGTPGAEAPDESLMLTGDENIVDLSFAVQWRVSDAAAYLFLVKDPDDAVKAVAESAMREVVGHNALKSILTDGRGAVQDQTQALMQKVLDHYRSGITIDAVQIQNANPPAEVVPAYQDIAKAGQDAQSAINDANAYRNKVVNEARGAAAKIVQEAQGYREQVVRYAQGQASAFDQLYPQYRRAPAVTRERLYLEMMERVLGHSHKVIIDEKGATAPIILPPDLFRGNTALQVSPPPSGQGGGQ